MSFPKPPIRSPQSAKKSPKSASKLKDTSICLTENVGAPGLDFQTGEHTHEPQPAPLSPPQPPRVSQVRVPPVSILRPGRPRTPTRPSFTPTAVGTWETTNPLPAAPGLADNYPPPEHTGRQRRLGQSPSSAGKFSPKGVDPHPPTQKHPLFGVPPGSVVVYNIFRMNMLHDATGEQPVIFMVNRTPRKYGLFALKIRPFAPFSAQMQP